MAQQDYDRSIHSNPDAMAWAKFYKETFPEADLDTMHGWFANAMMAMHDHIYQTKNVAEKDVPVNALVSLPVYAEYEDQLPNMTDDIYKKMFDMSSVIDGVRMFAYVNINGQRYYLRSS